MTAIYQRITGAFASVLPYLFILFVHTLELMLPEWHMHAIATKKFCIEYSFSFLGWHPFPSLVRRIRYQVNANLCQCIFRMKTIRAQNYKIAQMQAWKSTFEWLKHYFMSASVCHNVTKTQRLWWRIVTFLSIAHHEHLLIIMQLLLFHSLKEIYFIFYGLCWGDGFCTQKFEFNFWRE